VDWQDILAWVLQAVGAAGAVWGLYSENTSKEVKGRKSLTPKGLLALTGILLGIVGFAVNQRNEHQKSTKAEQRAKDAEQTLARVSSGQSELSGKQQTQLGILEEQTRTQTRQIEFLSNIALAQQQLSGVELSWPTSQMMQARIGEALRRIQIPAGSRDPTQDAYFRTCIEFGEFILTRRANYSWRLDCTIGRPQGILNTTFEIAPGDSRAPFVEAFLDALLSPQFVFMTTAGDEILSFSTAVRPDRIERRDARYTILHNELRTRLSTLRNASGEFRMQFPNTAGLPSAIRVRSLDPLLRLDTSWQMNWRLKEVGIVRTWVDVGDDPIEVKQFAAASSSHALGATFDRLLLVPEKTN